MRRREVLPLQAGVRQLLLDGLDELIDEVEIGLARHPLVAPAEVLGVVQPLRVVGPHVQHDRQRPLGADAADQRVQGELADGDAQAAGALVADAQDPLAVGHDDDVHLGVGPVPQQRRDRVAQRVGDEQAAGPAVDVAELLARLRDHRRVDHRASSPRCGRAAAGRRGPRWCPAARAGRCAAPGRRPFAGRPRRRATTC